MIGANRKKSWSSITLDRGELYEPEIRISERSFTGTLNTGSLEKQFRAGQSKPLVGGHKLENQEQEQIKMADEKQWQCLVNTDN